MPYSPPHWQEKGRSQGGHEGVVVTMGPRKRGTAVSTYCLQGREIPRPFSRSGAEAVKPPRPFWGQTPLYQE